MNPITDPNVRARRIMRTSYVGIGANILLAGFKAAVGLLSNSVAIVLDAFHVFLTVGIYAVDPARRADRDGNVVKRFHPTTAPETIDAEIAKLL